MDKQLTMSFWQDELSEVKTHKKEFLEQMDRLVPWGEWVKKIQPHYYKGERGNKPYDLELMLPDIRIAEPVQPGGHGGDERDYRQPCVFGVLPC